MVDNIFVDAIEELSYSDLERFASHLEKCIASFKADCNTSEKLFFSVIWSELLAAVAPDLEIPGKPEQLHALMVLVQGALAGHSAEVVVEPAPNWLPSSLLDEIRAESKRCAPVLGPDDAIQKYASSGPVGRRIIDDGRFWDWAESNLKRPLSRRAACDYIFYGVPGQRCKLHIDKPKRFQYNCLIGISHELPQGVKKPSVLRIFTNEEILDVQLAAGTAVLFMSSVLPHGRTPLQPGERITVLTLGLTDSKF